MAIDPRHDARELRHLSLNLRVGLQVVHPGRGRARQIPEPVDRPHRDPRGERQQRDQPGRPRRGDRPSDHRDAEQERDDGPEDERGVLRDDREREARRQAGDVERTPLAARAPQEIERAKHEAREPEIRGDERRVGGDVRLDRVEREGHHGGPEAEPLARPDEQERAERHAQQDDHEPAGIEQPVRVVLDVEKLLAESIQRPGPRARRGALDVRHIEVRRAHRRHGQRRPHPKERRVLRINAVVVLDERRVAVRDVDGLVPGRRLLRVAGDFEQDERQRKCEEDDDRGAGSGWRGLTRWRARSGACFWRGTLRHEDSLARFGRGTKKDPGGEARVLCVAGPAASRRSNVLEHDLRAHAEHARRHDRRRVVEGRRSKDSGSSTDNTVFTLTKLKASNMTFSLFLPPRKVKTFCALRSRSFVVWSRVAPRSWNSSVL